MPQLITEAGTLTPSGTGRLKITLITPGWGSSGYYSREMLKQAAEDVVFPKGTQQHIDHMSPSDHMEKPAGSLQTLAAVLTEDAVWEPDHLNEDGSKGRLAADSMLGSTYRQTISEFAEYIGTSISANAEVSKGEAEGRTGMIVEKLLPDRLNRVDFVTVAGRGGRISEVVEAAVRRATEATANDKREWLQDAVRAAHGAESVYAFVLDFDDTNVWFEVHTPDDSSTYQQGYTVSGNTAQLEGDPIEVRIETRYVPISSSTDADAEESAHTDSPSSTAGVTEKKEAATMATTTIEESEYATLKENASRATTLETELKEAKAREAALVKSNNDATAARIVAEAFDGIKAPKTINRLSESYKLNEEGAVDEAALKAEAEESAAEWKVANGEGTVRGVGQSSVVEESKEVADGDILTALKGGK